jgi:hypothetical protein
MGRFFDLVENLRARGRWQLGSAVDEQGVEIDSWQFIEGKFLNLGCVPTYSIVTPGNPPDFGWDIDAVPVVSTRFVELFEKLTVQGVQFIPVRVEGHDEPRFILNTLRVIRCIDDTRCAEVQYFTPEDNQPERVGEYRAVHSLRIDSTKAGDSHIFRTWGWLVALIVSEDIKQAFEKEGLTGAKFIEV